MKHLVHWNEKLVEQGKESSCKLYSITFAKNKTLQTGIRFTKWTNAKWCQELWFNFTAFYIIPIGEDSKYWTSLLLRSSQIHSVRCSTCQLIGSRWIHCLYECHYKVNFSLDLVCNRTLVESHLINIICILILPAKKIHNLTQNNAIWPNISLTHRLTKCHADLQ